MANIKQLIETKPVANRTYNLDSGDINMPYSFNIWVDKNVSILKNDQLEEYKKYKYSWYSLKTIQVAQNAVEIKSQYVELLKQVLKDYEIDLTQILKQIDYDDITDLGIIIPHITKSLKNEIIKIQKNRKELPKIIKSFNFIGSTNGIQLELTDHILKNFYIDKNEYNIEKTYNNYPSLSSVNNKLSVEVEELYDLTSNYYNSFYSKDIEDYVDLDVQKKFKLLEELSDETIKYAQEGRYYNFDWENIYSILNNTTLDYINENIAYLLNDSSGEDIITSTGKRIELDFSNNSIDELPIYLFEKYDRIKDNLLNIVSIFKKYIGSDIYYHKKDTTNLNGKLIDADNPSDNILNLSNISIANIPNYSDNQKQFQIIYTEDGKILSTESEKEISIFVDYDYNLRSIKEIGGYFVPDKLGLSVIIDKNITWEIDWDNSEEGKFYAYPNPDIYSDVITSGLLQNIPPILFHHSYKWMLHSKISKRSGQVQNENTERHWEGYISVFENYQRNSLGLNSQDDITILGNSNTASPWLSSDFTESDEDGVDYAWIIIPSLRQYNYRFYFGNDNRADPNFFRIGENIFKWIKENKQKYKIDLVLATGDLVTYNYEDSEWQSVRNWFKHLDNVVPYVISKGEYDYGVTNSFGDYAASRNQFPNARTTQMDNWFKPWNNNKNTTLNNYILTNNSSSYVNNIFDGTIMNICSYPNGYNGTDAFLTYDDNYIKVYKTEVNYTDTSLTANTVYKKFFGETEIYPHLPSINDICYMDTNRFAIASLSGIKIFAFDKLAVSIDSSLFITSNYQSGESVNGLNCLRYDPNHDEFYGMVGNNLKIVKLNPLSSDWSNGFNATLLWNNSQSTVGYFDYNYTDRELFIIQNNDLYKYDLSGNNLSIINFDKLGSKLFITDDKTRLFTNTNPGIIEYRFYNNIDGMFVEKNIFSQASRFNNLSGASEIRYDLNNQMYEYISPDNRNYLIFSTEFGPRTSVLSAISATLMEPQYSNHEAILLTHAYLYPPVSGLSGRYSDNYDVNQDHTLIYPSTTPTLTAYTEYNNGSFTTNDGKRIYEKLLNSVPNFKFTFSGHHRLNDGPESYAERISTTQYGNQISSLAYETNTVTGNIRIIQFMNGGRKIKTRTLSTITGLFYDTSIFDHTISLSG